MLIHSDSKESNLSHQERSAFIRRDWEERGRTVSSFKRREESENCLRTKTKRLIEQRRSIEQVSKQTGPSDSVRSEQRHTPDADKLTRTTCSRSARNSNLFLAGFVRKSLSSFLSSIVLNVKFSKWYTHPRYLWSICPVKLSFFSFVVICHLLADCCCDRVFLEGKLDGWKWEEECI